MNVNQYPWEYEKERKEMLEKEILECEEKERSERQAQSRELLKKIEVIRAGINYETVDVFMWSLYGFGVGVVVAIWACTSFCFERVLLTPFIIWCIGAIMGGVLANKINSDRKTDEANANREIEICEETLKKITQDIRKNAEEDIMQLRARAKQDIDKYVSEFEIAARNMSVNYAESPLVAEVVNWMTNGFVKTIDAADRREHIETIQVPFVFKVYSNQITCNLGTYDFEIKRCANLGSGLVQTAVSRAIASAVQLNINMQYDKDSAGMEFVIDTEYNYNYPFNHTTVTIYYTAPNGNYQPTLGW